MITSTTVQVDGKSVTIGLEAAQLTARREGDLITAVILAVKPHTAGTPKSE